MPPLSLYIHVPWCVRKCPYCDFNSHELREALPEDAYVDALLRDLDAASPWLAGRTFHSLFIGGGTPSLLSPGAIQRLLRPVSPRLSFGEETEVTLEANPGAIEADKFRQFREAGITRLSLGVQSFDTAKLQALGRIHDAPEARRAVERALRAFDRVNLDLMYGLPGQSLTEARRDLETAIALGPGHISAYHLTVEPNTAFHHAPPELPDDDLAADMQDMVEATLASAGYQHYETSAFAWPGQRCWHNLNYWTFGDYLGIGAGAHSKLTMTPDVCREARPRHPADYLADPVTRHWQPVAQPDLAGEFMMNALRLNDGFSPAMFEAQTGLSLMAIEHALRRAEQEGLLVDGAQGIAATPLGRRFLNRLIGLFLAD